MSNSSSKRKRARLWFELPPKHYFRLGLLADVLGIPANDVMVSYLDNPRSRFSDDESKDEVLSFVGWFPSDCKSANFRTEEELEVAGRLFNEFWRKFSDWAELEERWEIGDMSAKQVRQQLREAFKDWARERIAQDKELGLDEVKAKAFGERLNLIKGALERWNDLSQEKAQSESFKFEGLLVALMNELGWSGSLPAVKPSQNTMAFLTKLIDVGVKSFDRELRHTRAFKEPRELGYLRILDFDVDKGLLELEVSWRKLDFSQEKRGLDAEISAKSTLELELGGKSNLEILEDLLEKVKASKASFLASKIQL